MFAPRWLYAVTICYAIGAPATHPDAGRHDPGTDGSLTVRLDDNDGGHLPGDVDGPPRRRQPIRFAIVLSEMRPMMPDDEKLARSQAELIRGHSRFVCDGGENATGTWKSHPSGFRGMTHYLANVITDKRVAYP
jgi:hypothetical protein